MNLLELSGTIVGLIYLYLEYRASVWLWSVGVIMPVIYMFVYYDAGLYADMGISVYYLLASLYGLICWIRASGKSRREPSFNGNSEATIDYVNNNGIEIGDSEKSEMDGIRLTPRNLYCRLILAVVGCSVLISIILQGFTDSTVPWADGFTTALSIVAMWMLAKKYVEQWLVWILADVGCSLLYIYKDLCFTSGLYALYAAIAWFGYKKWMKLAMKGNGSAKNRM